jgi:hypothetical protein
MDVQFGVLADFASITREGKLNILGIFDQISPPQLPFALPIFYVVVTYSANPAEFEMVKSVSIRLMTQDGAGPLMQLEQEMTIPRSPRPGMRSTINQVNAIMGFPFQEPGTYEFAILIDGQTRGGIPLHVLAPPGGQDESAS